MEKTQNDIDENQMYLRFPPDDVAASEPKRLARASDPITSKKAAQQVAYRTGSQKHRLLIQYRNSGPLTDEEASDLAGLAHGGWKRCSDLRNEDMIEDTGETRLSSSQMQTMVCRITDRGVALLGTMKEPDDRPATGRDTHIHIWTWAAPDYDYEHCRDCGAIK